MSVRSTVLAVCLAALAPAFVPVPPLHAQQATEPAGKGVEIAPLVDLLGIPDLAPILRAEGLRHAADLEEEMFPGRGGGRWKQIYEGIYRTDRMVEVMTRELQSRLSAEHVAELEAFFGSEVGRRIVLLEVTAREAMLEDAVEEASRAAAEDLRSSEKPRAAQLDAFVTANDLVEMNVAGALNSNLAFYRGLDAGGAFDGTLSETEMLGEVWAQEPEIRAETESWVYSYLALAYQPLEDEDLAAYIAMSESAAGKALNTALFAGFDTLFTTISYELGAAAARFAAGQDI